MIAAAGPWIPVTERLPEPGVMVLVWMPESADADEDFSFALITTESRTWLECPGARIIDPSHWSPLTPPEAR